jgi:hypothetical protein
MMKIAESLSLKIRLLRAQEPPLLTGLGDLEYECQCCCERRQHRWDQLAKVEVEILSGQEQKDWDASTRSDDREIRQTRKKSLQTDSLSYGVKELVALIKRYRTRV